MGVLCVVGDTGKIETSTNHGASWTARTSGTTKHLCAVASKPDATLTVAVGDQGAVTTSTDQGATWTLQTGPNTTDYLTGVAWNGTRWVAVGYNFGGAGGYTNAVSWTSTDAVTWTAGTIVASIFGLNPKAVGVALLGTTFYAAVSSAANGVNIPAGIYSSTNGTTWGKQAGFSAVAPPQDGGGQTQYYPTAIGSTGTRLMVAAGVGSTTQCYMFTSTTGSTWASAGGAGSMTGRGVAGYGSGWVVVGNYTDARAAYTATDSFTASSAVAPGLASGVLWAVAWSGSKYAAAASDGEVFTSTTGASWTANATNTANAKYGICNIPNSAPTASLLVSPANNAYIDLSVAQSFVTTFQDPDLPLDSQKRIAIKFTRTAPTAGAAQWWDGAAMQASETYITQTSGTVTVDAGAIGSNGETYSWTVITKDQLDTAGAYASTRSFTGSLPPTLTVDAPTGTVTDTTVPAVAWSYADTESTAQESAQVKIFTAAQYGAGGFDPVTSTPVYDSGVVYTAAETLTPTVDLDNLTTYRAYVQVAQVGAQTSDWEYSGFDLDIDAPDPPVLSVQPQPGFARTQLTAAGALAPYTSGSYVFEYHDGDGDWQTLLGGTVAVPIAETWSVYDYLAPPAAPRTYRVRTVTALSSTTQVSSASSQEQVVTLTPATCWLKHKTIPTYNMALRVGRNYSWKQTVAAQAFDTSGSQFPVVLDDVAKGVSGTLTVATWDPTETAALQALLDTKTAVLFQAPDGEQHWLWVMSISRDLVSSHVSEGWWSWSLAVVEVAEPQE